MRPLILIARGVRALRNGKQSAKQYPFWDELIPMLGDYEVQEITEMPLDQLEALIKSSLTVICCDSFIQHFCWSIDKKAVVLWGKSDPLIFGHASNVNLLKSRKYLRPDPWRWWEDVEPSNAAWVRPEIIVSEIKKLVST